MKISILAKISFLTVMLFLLLSCKKASEPVEKPQLRMVRTLKIETPGENFWREFPGVVEAAQKADLGFRIAGKLEKMFVKEGDVVKRGQLLAQLDATDYNIQLKSRQAEYDQVHADFERGESLVEKRLISRSDYDKMKAQDEAAKASLAAAKQNLEYTSLLAPFSGRIAKRYVENFEDVSAKQPVYALQDLSSMTIKVSIPESVMIRVRKGAKPEVNAIFDQIPRQQFPLSLKEVSTQADENTNTYEITFTMPAISDFNILPGMSVTVRGKPEHEGIKDSVIYVPAHTVLEDSEGRFVYVVKGEDDNHGIVEKRMVKTGKLSNLGLAITSGLKIGDEVVTAGMSKMRSGLEVKLQPENTN